MTNDKQYKVFYYNLYTSYVYVYIFFLKNIYIINRLHNFDWIPFSLPSFLPSILPLILSKLPPMVQRSDRSHAGIWDLKAAYLGILKGRLEDTKIFRKFSLCFYGNLKKCHGDLTAFAMSPITKNHGWMSSCHSSEVAVPWNVPTISNNLRKKGTASPNFWPKQAGFFFAFWSILVMMIWWK